MILKRLKTPLNTYFPKIDFFVISYNPNAEPEIKIAGIITSTLNPKIVNVNNNPKTNPNKGIYLSAM